MTPLPAAASVARPNARDAMLSELALSAITDLLLAVMQAFAAGLLFRPGLARGSAAWLWAVSMAVIAVVFLLGGLDHGFYEMVDHPLHPAMTAATRVLVAVASFMLALVAARRFLRQRAARVTVLCVGAFEAAVIALVLTSDNFFVVIAGYAGVLLLLLGLAVAGLRTGAGSVAMIAGIVITLGASAIPVVGYEIVAGFGAYATYHVALMPAVFAFYLAGRALDDGRDAPRAGAAA